MFTINTIIKEISDLPPGRLEEVYEFVHSLNTKPKKSRSSRKKILAFAGSFSDMPQKDYNDYKKQTKQARKSLFDRNATDI